MLVKVTKDTVKIVEEDYILNKGEYHINTCYFEFSDEYTDDLVKKAIFVHGDTKKEMLIANNQCNIPYEVLVNDEFELRVYAYEIDENEELVLRYSPTYTNAYLREGSYVSGATASEEITPTQFEQYQQALQDGLAEVNEKLDDVNTAITEANNLDADVIKVAKISTLSITKKDGTIKSVDILDGADGKDGETGPAGKDGKDGVDGKDGTDGITPTIGNNGNWYLGDEDTGKPSRGATGEQGPAGRDGTNGADGIDGFSPIANVSKSGTTSTITITDKNGTTTASVNDGINGTNGQDGQDGYSPTASVSQSGKVTTISITDKNGTTSESIDLTNYITNTDYAGLNIAGVVKANIAYGTNVTSGGIIYPIELNYVQYQSAGGECAIGKSTLENVITGKELVNKTYVDGLVGDINTALDGINGESI